MLEHLNLQKEGVDTGKENDNVFQQNKLVELYVSKGEKKDENVLSLTT